MICINILDICFLHHVVSLNDHWTEKKRYFLNQTQTFFYKNEKTHFRKLLTKILAFKHGIYNGRQFQEQFIISKRNLHTCAAIEGRCSLVVVVVVVVVVVASNVAVRGGNLKDKEAGGGLGARAQRLPPSALAGGLRFGCCCCCCCPWVPSGGAVLVAVGCVVAVVAAVAVVAVVPVVAVVALVVAVAALVALAAAFGGASGAGAIQWYVCRCISACWDWCGAGGGRAAHLNTRTCRRH